MYGKASRLASFPAAHGNLGTRLHAQLRKQLRFTTRETAALHTVSNQLYAIAFNSGSSKRCFVLPLLVLQETEMVGLVDHCMWTPTMTNRAPSPSRPSSANQQRGRSSNETQPSPTDTTSSMDGTGNGEVLSILRSLQQQVSVLQAQQGLRSNSESSNTTPQRETRDKETPRKRLPKELVVRTLYTYIMLGLTYL